MPEDLNPSDFEMQKNNAEEPEKNNDPFETEESPKKRIIKRRLSGTKKTSPQKKDKEEELKKEKKEIDEVLTNLYGHEANRDDVQEITIVKSGFAGRFFSTLLIIAIFAGLVWAGFLFIPQKNTDEGQVGLSITGPRELSLGATTTYTISYENRSSVTMNGVILNAYFPEGFVYLSSNPKPRNAGHNEWDLTKLSAYEKGSITVTGLTYGSIEEQKSWRVFLNYTPENFASELQKAATLTTVINSSPVKLTISGPDKAAVGSDVTYIFSMQKNIPWKGALAVAPLLPDNFAITSSSPSLDKKTGHWNIPAITGSSTASVPKNFTLTGKFVSSAEEPSPIKGAVLLPASPGENYQIALAQITTDILKNDVSVSFAINGTVTDFDSRPGDTLNMTVRVKNQSQTEITNIVPKITLTAPSDKRVSLLKWADLVDKNENIIVGEQVDDFTRRGIISWTKDQVPELAKLKPGGEVIFDVQLPVKTGKEFPVEKIKNPLIIAAAEAKFRDPAKSTQTIGGKNINITLNSDLSFANDDSVSGAGSPGEKHTINWILNNNFHALKDIKVTATVFGDTDFTLLDKAAGELSFDKDEKKIIWNINEMPDGTDIFNCSFTLTLNKLNPSQSLLLSKVHITATDAVTGKNLTLAGEEISLQTQ